jgi:hypothetical protein
MNLFLRRWSHVVSSRLYVIHRTEQPIHSGVASNHGSYKLCLHMRRRFATNILYAFLGLLCVLHISLSLLSFGRRICTGAQNLASSNFNSFGLVVVLQTFSLVESLLAVFVIFLSSYFMVKMKLFLGLIN